MNSPNRGPLSAVVRRAPRSDGHTVASGGPLGGAATPGVGAGQDERADAGRGAHRAPRSQYDVFGVFGPPSHTRLAFSMQAPEMRPRYLQTHSCNEVQRRGVESGARRRTAAAARQPSPPSCGRSARATGPCAGGSDGSGEILLETWSPENLAGRSARLQRRLDPLCLSGRGSGSGSHSRGLVGCKSGFDAVAGRRVRSRGVKCI